MHNRSRLHSRPPPAADLSTLIFCVFIFLAEIAFLFAAEPRDLQQTTEWV